MSCTGLDSEIRQGDLLPVLTVNVNDKGVPVDLTAASSVTIMGYQNGVQVFSRPATSVAVGQATMNWQAGDTTTVGPMTIFVRAVFASKQLTIEAENQIQVLRFP